MRLRPLPLPFAAVLLLAAAILISTELVLMQCGQLAC